MAQIVIWRWIIWKIIPLPVPNWASAEEQFISNYPPQITIYSKFFFENPNFSLSTKFFLLDLSVGVLFSKLSTSRSQFVGQILNSDPASSYFPFNTPTMKNLDVQRKIRMNKEKFGCSKEKFGCSKKNLE